MYRQSGVDRRDQRLEQSGRFGALVGGFVLEVRGVDSSSSEAVEGGYEGDRPRRQRVIPRCVPVDDK